MIELVIAFVLLAAAIYFFTDYTLNNAIEFLIVTFVCGIILFLFVLIIKLMWVAIPL